MRKLFSSLGLFYQRDAFRERGGGAIGLVAGRGDFPCVLARALRERGYSPVVVAVEREDDDTTLRDLGEAYHKVGLEDGSRIIGILEEHRVKDLLLAGKVDKKRILSSSFKGDALSEEVVESTQAKGDDRILRNMAWILRIRGFRFLSPSDFLPECVTPQGVLSRRKPSSEERGDLDFGLRVARVLGRLDIGQTVVVRKGAVVALEALEGTDETILRAGRLTQGSVVVKLAKPQQDLRLDMPVAGPETVVACRESGARLLALHALKSLMLHKEEMIRLSDEAHIALVGITA